MNKLLAIILSLLFILTATPAFADEQSSFTYQIIQDNRIIDCSSGEIQLKRAPFAMILALKQATGILIAASGQPDRYRLAKGGAPLETFILPATGMAEALFNENNDIMLSAEGTNYWYYENDRDHRFNKVTRDNEILTCERYIENIFDTDKTGGAQRIEETDLKNLYLVLVHADYIEETYSMEEIQRETLKIDFQ